MAHSIPVLRSFSATDESAAEDYTYNAKDPCDGKDLYLRVCMSTSCCTVRAIKPTFSKLWKATT